MKASWTETAGGILSSGRQRRRRAAIAAGAAVLSAAAIGGAVLSAQPASAATAKAALAAAGPLIELQVGDSHSGAVCEGWHTAALEGDGHTLWGTFTEARAVASSRTVGTCIGTIREDVRYPSSETLTWSASAHSGRDYYYQPAKKVYGKRGSVHYWTWTINHWLPGGCYEWAQATAGSHVGTTAGTACLA